jgi:hypothetical protein
MTVAAVNAAGIGVSAATSVTPARAPGAPGQVVVTPGIRSAAVSWAAPVDIGGAPVSGYVVTVTGGAVPLTAKSITRRVVFSGLDPARTYVVTVAATNRAGTGVASAPSAGFSPRAR